MSGAPVYLHPVAAAFLAVARAGADRARRSACWRTGWSARAGAWLASISRFAFRSSAPMQRERLLRKTFSLLRPRASWRRASAGGARRSACAAWCSIEGEEHIEGAAGRAPSSSWFRTSSASSSKGLRMTLDYRGGAVYVHQKDAVHRCVSETQARALRRHAHDCAPGRREGHLRKRCERAGIAAVARHGSWAARESVFVPFFGVHTATVTALSRHRQAGRRAIVSARHPPACPAASGYVVRFYPAWDDYPGERC